MDPDARKVRRVVATSGFPSDVTVGEGAVWVLDAEAGVLKKIDPAYGTVIRSARVARSNAGTYERSREAIDAGAVAAGLGSA